MPGQPPLPVGIVGCGALAQSVHLNVLASLPGVRVTAVADPDPERRGSAARRCGAEPFTDYEEMFARAEAEAILIAAPSHLHAETAVAAFDRGKHVYLEKPLAVSLEEGRAVLQAWRRSARVGMIGFNYRFNPLYGSLRRHIASGRCGEVVAVRSVFSSSLRHSPAWKQTRRTGGGALLELGSHHMDLVRYLFGREIREVFARLRSQSGEADSAAVDLRLDDGLLVQSFFSLCAAEEDRFEVYGQEATLTVDRYRSWKVEIGSPRQGCLLRGFARPLQNFLSASHLVRKLRAPGREPSYGAALAAFVAAVRSGRPQAPDLFDGYRSLEAISAAEESASSSRAVQIPISGGTVVA